MLDFVLFIKRVCWTGEVTMRLQLRKNLRSNLATKRLVKRQTWSYVKTYENLSYVCVSSLVKRSPAEEELIIAFLSTIFQISFAIW